MNWFVFTLNTVDGQLVAVVRAENRTMAMVRLVDDDPIWHSSEVLATQPHVGGDGGAMFAYFPGFSRKEAVSLTEKARRGE